MIRYLSLLMCLFVSSISIAEEKILILGDSLSAGYQMPIEQAWPSLLADELSNYDKNVTIINGSISGDTTGNGLARLPMLLDQHLPDLVVIELGANDGLRGFPPKVITSNLTKMIDMAKAAGSNVAVMQIRVPPNYGKRYSDTFYNIYPKVTEQHSVPLIPFFLEYVITKPEWMMNDGLHPKPDAQPWIAKFVAKELDAIL